MKTIKLPYKSDYDLTDLMRQYTILIKSCYNKSIKGFTDKEIRLYLKTLNNVGDLDSKFVENAIIDKKTFQKENKIIFRKSNFIKRSKNKIDKKEFKENKYLPIINYGEKSCKGNRKFQIDLDKNKIIFKLNRKTHINIYLPKLKINYLKELNKVQNLMEECKISVSFKLDTKNIYISYEEIVKDNLIKRCKINSIKVYLIHPAYTTFIGNLQYDYFDPINASIEVARRGYQYSKMYLKNKFYPKFSLKNQWNQWKKEVGLFTEDWKELYKQIKTLDLSYRVPLNEVVFRKICINHIIFNLI